MRAITVRPGIANSAKLEEVPEPALSEGAILARTVSLGVCGTDREIVAGLYGESPAGDDHLILGHESFGIVENAPPGSGFARGDFVVGIVRRPDPVPCPACAGGEWDMCLNGRYTERGIKARHGYGAERFRIEPEFAVKIDPRLGALGVLMEPTSIVAKAWDHVDRIGGRFRAWAPRNALITGSGPIGLLAAMIGVQRGLDVHVFDRNREGPKPALIKALGATHASAIPADLKPDIIMECTGAAAVIAEVLGSTAPAGVVCLLSVTAPGRKIEIDIGQLNRTLVLDNDVIFGAVNANRTHYRLAAEALQMADQGWLNRLITRRVPLNQWQDALEYRRGDIKVVVDITQ